MNGFLVTAGRKRNRKNNQMVPPIKAKIKTRWSSTTDLSGHTLDYNYDNNPNNNNNAKNKNKNKNNGNSKNNSNHNVNQNVATEEHGYYVRRTFVAAADANNLLISKDNRNNKTETNTKQREQSPAYLAVPIAWIDCKSSINDNNICEYQMNAIRYLSMKNDDGFLCDDDCTDPYEPVCGRTINEVALFYNKCKLNVAKCRTHGLWSEYEFNDCNNTYNKQLIYADAKFRKLPYFREQKLSDTTITTTTTTMAMTMAMAMETEQSTAPTSEQSSEATTQVQVKDLPEATINLAKNPNVEEIRIHTIDQNSFDASEKYQSVTEATAKPLQNIY